MRKSPNGVAFDFSGNGSAFPAPYNSGATYMEVVWTGNFTANVAGSYIFTTGSDDGSRLWIDGSGPTNTTGATLVVDNWFDQGTTYRSGTITLSAGLHTIAIAFYNGVVRLLATMQIDVEDDYLRYLDEFPLPRD